MAKTYEEKRQHVVVQACIRFQDLVATDYDMDIDSTARVLVSGDAGYWVQAWVFVPRADVSEEYQITEEEEEKENGLENEA